VRQIEAHTKLGTSGIPVDCRDNEEDIAAGLEEQIQAAGSVLEAALHKLPAWLAMLDASAAEASDALQAQMSQVASQLTVSGLSPANKKLHCFVQEPPIAAAPHLWNDFGSVQCLLPFLASKRT
jgi:hypothetical protein